MVIPDGQYTQLLAVLNRIADRQFTISEAADWPLAVILLGALAVLVSWMWKDMKKSFSDIQTGMVEHRKEVKGDISRIELQVDEMWRTLRICQQRHALKLSPPEDRHE